MCEGRVAGVASTSGPMGRPPEFSDAPDMVMVLLCPVQCCNIEN